MEASILIQPEKRLSELFLNEISEEPFFNEGQKKLIGLIMETALCLFREERHEKIVDEHLNIISKK